MSTLGTQAGWGTIEAHPIYLTIYCNDVSLRGPKDESLCTEDGRLMYWAASCEVGARCVSEASVGCAWYWRHGKTVEPAICSAGEGVCVMQRI